MGFGGYTGSYQGGDPGSLLLDQQTADATASTTSDATSGTVATILDPITAAGAPPVPEQAALPGTNASSGIRPDGTPQWFYDWVNTLGLGNLGTPPSMNIPQPILNFQLPQLPAQAQNGIFGRMMGSTGVDITRNNSVGDMMKAAQAKMQQRGNGQTNFLQGLLNPNVPTMPNMNSYPGQYMMDNGYAMTANGISL